MTIQAVTAQILGAVKSYPFHLIFAAFLVSLLWNKFHPGLYNIPGPTIASYTKLWRLIDVWKGHSELTAIQLHRKYGPLVRIAPKSCQWPIQRRSKRYTV
jgi:hypothetical protein